MKKIIFYSLLLVVIFYSFAMSVEVVLAANLIGNTTTYNNLLDKSDPNSLIFTPSITIPGSDFKASTSMVATNDLLAKYLKANYKFFVGIAGIFATFMISLGGFIWLTSGGNASRINTGKEFIGGAVSGLVLILLSYLFLVTLNPRLIDLSLGIKKVDRAGLSHIYDSAPAAPTAAPVPYVRPRPQE